MITSTILAAALVTGQAFNHMEFHARANDVARAEQQAQRSKAAAIHAQKVAQHKRIAQLNKNTEWVVNRAIADLLKQCGSKLEKYRDKNCTPEQFDAYKLQLQKHVLTLPRTNFSFDKYADDGHAKGPSVVPYSMPELRRIWGAKWRAASKSLGTQDSDDNDNSLATNTLPRLPEPTRNITADAKHPELLDGGWKWTRQPIEDNNGAMQWVSGEYCIRPDDTAYAIWHEPSGEYIETDIQSLVDAKTFCFQDSVKRKRKK